jgi:hypothetical protein
MKAFVLSLLIACSLTACARSTQTDAQIDAQYNKLLVEYGNAELYKIQTRAACNIAITVKKAKNVFILCTKNLDDVTNELLNKVSLPYLKRHVDPDSLDPLIQFYSQDKVKKIAPRIITDPYSATEEESKTYTAILYTAAGKRFEKYLYDTELSDKLDDASLKYLQEHETVK